MSPVLEMPVTVVDRKPKKKKFPRVFLLFICVFLAILAIFLYQGRIISTQNTFSPILIDIKSPLSATYTEVFVNHGTTVQKGGILARFDISDYVSQLPNANVLVAGALPTPEQTEKMVKEAQSAEADMVNRIALARHEENAKHALMEKLSVEHARAQLHLRSIQEKAAREKAQQRVQQAQEALQQAKNAHEEASRQRMAVEGILHNIRAERYAQGMGVAAVNPKIPVESIADHIVAPQDGRIVGQAPTVGQVIQKGELVFNLMPSSGAQFIAVAHMKHKEASSLRINMPAFLLAGDILLQGTVIQIIQEGDKNLVSLSLQAQGQDFAALDAALAAGDSKAVFWPNTWIRKYIPNAVLSLLCYV